MTGEITLRGKVLPVGGIREKVLSAHRSGIRIVIIPAENERDLDDLPATIREQLKIHLVEKVEEVLQLAFSKG
jgi:ATP-dependent Lon protease